MKPTTGLVSALFVFTVAALLVAPAPADAQNHCSQCTCASACTTPCYYLERVNPGCIPTQDDPCTPEWEQVETTCGGWGKCTSSASCQTGSCTNLSCGTTINLGSGNDTYNGTAALECIYGNDGNDTLDGKAGDDRIYGGTGTDTLFGDSGNDCLWGQGGNDHTDGGSGSDFCDGGAGTDTNANCEALANFP